MTETAKIWLSDAKKTVSAGGSLARTLYAVPLTVRLCGAIGAGKTTFFQGFAAGLGVRAHVQSPTFALEQRYGTPQHGELLHIDLHRLSEGDAQKLLLSTASHPGIRCIEWPERAGILPSDGPTIDMLFDDEDPRHRQLTVAFRDVAVPDRAHVLAWREAVCLPQHIGRHCDAVGEYAEELAGGMLRRGILARPLLLLRAGELHDLLRFLDFREGCDGVRVWKEQRARFPSLAHESACAAFLEEEGYAAMGRVVRTHGARLPPDAEATIEQKLLFYADKRLKIDEFVTLEERLQDFHMRYGDDPRGAGWYAQARDVERELFLRSATE